ncbi:MAG: hydrogenase maturation protease [Candidatus Korobacteraceae bacterium]|jgi:hydrogenase maturation protease
MKPLLAIGLGNPLMGDDGVGCVVAERLASDPRLPDCAEVIGGGSDLLGCAGQMEGRRRVVVIDAIQGDSEPGSVMVFEGARSGLDEQQDHAHQLSAVQAIRLLEKIKSIRCTLLGISISSVATGTSLSPQVEVRMPAILDSVLQELSRPLEAL